MRNVVPSLSPDGWVKSIPAMADQLFADFIVANNSQYPFAKIDASLPWLIARHPENANDLENACKVALQTYFDSWMQGAKILVSARVLDVEGKPLNWDLRLGVQIQYEGVTHEVCNSIQVGEQKVLSVVRIANGSLPFTA